jgi:ABC-type multidrug transport system fused ATPase/permease subunit
VADIRRELFSHLLLVSMDFFNKHKSGELVHKINNDVDKIQHVLTNSIIRLINNTFQIVGIIILLCGLNLRLFLISCLVFPFLFLNSRYFGPIITRAYERLGKKQAGLTNYFKERLQNIKLIKLANGYDHERHFLDEHLMEVNGLSNAAFL